MKKKLYNICMPIAMCCILCLASCDKYLDVQPKGVQTLNTVADYNQWLNSTDLEFMPEELNLLGDNSDNTNLSNPASSPGQRVYSWESQFSTNENDVPLFWSYHYKNIYYYNTLLMGIDAAVGGSNEQKASLKAEALVGRALEYLYLVNEYGKVYNSSTASSDLAVPFVLSNDITDPTPNRSTVQQIYDHIINDLTAAIPSLPTDNSRNRCRGSVAAAYSLLARTYLFMGNYSQAAISAQKALDSSNSKMINYTTLNSADGIFAATIRTDALYSRSSSTILGSNVPTVAFLSTWNTADKRYSLWHFGFFPLRGFIIYYPFGSLLTATTYRGTPNWGTTVQEMHLIIAEAAARANDLTTALDRLDLIRVNRIPGSVKFTSTDQATVLTRILTERTFEMPFSGMRWFDMRRYDVENRMPVVTRTYTNNTVAATLQPHSPRYTFQVPIQVTYFNPGWIQNP
ncbi:MAG: RagB/SusD family nutrient uptake outer membrane protein [Bacteroidota bacterium]